ncbi:MAG TPA: dihydrofolate reductase family protein [Solirubrobacterales bacterium]|nr:dihydrofolate reductase family protein [Solirubrobacterales bacterium]
MKRLLPDPGPTDIETELAAYRPFDTPRDDRPHVAVNMVTSLDGRASLTGRSKGLGSNTDLELLLKLRTRFDAVMIGGGTMRAERYGRIVKDPQARARRERIGLPHDPLAVIISGRLDLPFDAPLFTDGGGRVLIFTNDESEMPETETPVRVERIEGPIRITEVLRHLRIERGIRALLCEGGPHVFGQIAAAGALDDLFLTISPVLTAEADAPRILEGALEEPERLELVNLTADQGDLFARYRRLGVA